MKMEQLSHSESIYDSDSDVWVQRTTAWSQVRCCCNCYSKPLSWALYMHRNKIKDTYVAKTEKNIGEMTSDVIVSSTATSCLHIVNVLSTASVGHPGAQGQLRSIHHALPCRRRSSGSVGHLSEILWQRLVRTLPINRCFRHEPTPQLLATKSQHYPIPSGACCIQRNQTL